MKEKLPELKLGSIFKVIEPQCLEVEKNISKGYYVGKLYDIGTNLSSRIYSNSINFNSTYLNICVNILLSCTFFIDNDYKFYLMFLICELTNEINALEIPYSITLISYENYNVIINKYDEERSLKVVQRIFDCFFINRFYTSLANSMKHVVK